MSTEEKKQSTLQDLLKFSSAVGDLKHTPRMGWVYKGVPDSEQVTGHAYRMAMIALFVLDEIPGCDKNKVVQLCLVHDFAECIVGDITPHDNIPVEVKHEKESQAIKSLASLLSRPKEEFLNKLYEEYEAKETIESQVTKDLDLFDMIHQAFEYEKKYMKKKLEELGEQRLDSEKRKNLFVNSPDLGEFMDPQNVLSRLKNHQIKKLVDELLSQRKEFLDSLEVELKNGCTNCSNDSGDDLVDGLVVNGHAKVF